MQKILSTFAIATLVAGSAHATGFIVNEHSAEATGKAGAVAATVRNGSAIQYNPAGIARIKGSHLFATGTGLTTSSSFDEKVGDEIVNTSPDGGVKVIPALFGTYQINDWLTAGASITFPFGSTVKWPDSSPQKDVMMEQALMTPTVTGVLGMNMDEWFEGLDLAFGIDVMSAGAYQKKGLLFGQDEGFVEIGVQTLGLGGRIGMMYVSEDLEGLSIGASWRAPLSLNATGTANFEVPAEYRGSLPPDGETEAQLNLPHVLNAGVALQYTDELLIEINLQFTGWSAYDKITFTFVDGSETNIVTNYHDSTTIRVGGEYDIGAADLRFGWAWDESPMRSQYIGAALPDMDRHLLTAGAGFNVNDQLTVDVGAMYVIPNSRWSAPKEYAPFHKAEYHVSAFLFNLSVGYSFGGEGGDDA